MIVSGAVFTDHFISQHLTEYIFLGGTPQFNERIYEIAKVLKALKLCLGELEEFYANLAPTTLLLSRRPRQPQKSQPLPAISSRTTPSLFPHFRSFSPSGGDDVRLEYMERLVPQHSEKAVFKAIAEYSDQKISVVVKFTPTYCARAHEIAYSKNSAPKLWFCEKVASVGMFVVVMDFIEGQCVDDETILSEDVLEALRDTISALHHENLVYGDLRAPNVILSDDGQGGKRAILLDFDWAGEEGTALYPADINMELTWHENVQPGRLICREHDLFMLDQLGAGESDD
jgi:serine/threonine protein kinase